jgi:hypothetical protein
MAYPAAICCDKTLPISSRINRLGASLCVFAQAATHFAQTHFIEDLPTILGYCQRTEKARKGGRVV